MVHNEEAFDRSHTQTVSLSVYQLCPGYALKLQLQLMAGAQSGELNRP